MLVMRAMKPRWWRGDTMAVGFARSAKAWECIAGSRSDWEVFFGGKNEARCVVRWKCI